MQRQILLIVIMCVGISLSTQAQDPIFSQYYAAPLQLNPAFTGNTYTPHLAFNYRSQWGSVPTAYVTYSASFSQFSERLNSGFGLMVLGDDAGQGLLKTNKLGGFYSYRLEMNRKTFIKIGLEASFVQYRLDWQKLIFPDQIDPESGFFTAGGTPIPTDEIQPTNLNKGYLDFSAGMLLYSSSFYVGLSAKHLNTPNESLLEINTNIDGGLPVRLSMHAGYEYEFRKGNKRRPSSFISPNIMFVKQGDFGQINAGAYANLGIVFGGLWYRHGFANPDAAIVLFGVKKGPYKIGYSYDITISKLTLGESGGSHEVSVILNFDKPRKVNYNDCFGLFR